MAKHLHAGHETRRPAALGISHQHQAGVAPEHALPDLVGGLVRGDPRQVAVGDRLDRPLAQAVLDGAVQGLARDHADRPAVRVDDRRGVDPALDERLLGVGDGAARLEGEEAGDHEVRGPRRGRQAPLEKGAERLAGLEGCDLLEARRGGGRVPAAAGERLEQAAEVDPGLVAPGDHRHPVALAKQGEEEREIEDLEAAVDQRRQLVDVVAELQGHEAHAVPADPVDLEGLGHAVEDVEAAGIETLQGVAPDDGEVRPALEEARRRPQVAGTGAGVSERSGVLVDAQQEEGGLDRRRGVARLVQELGQQGAGGPRLRVDPAAGDRQVALGGRVVVVGPELDGGVGGEPLGDHADPVALDDVAEHQSGDARRIHLLGPELGERELLAERPLEQTANRLLLRAGEEDPGLGVELARHEHGARGVEVGAQVGGDDLHAGSSLPGPTGSGLHHAPHPPRGAGGSGHPTEPAPKMRSISPVFDSSKETLRVTTSGRSAPGTIRRTRLLPG